MKHDYTAKNSTKFYQIGLLKGNNVDKRYEHRDQLIYSYTVPHG